MAATGPSDAHLQDLLSAVTDALLAGESTLDQIVRDYDVPRERVEGVMNLIRRLHTALTGVQPSRRFVRRLKIELVGETNLGIVNRVRYLPPRVQIAAGVALVAGFMILNRRRMLAEAHGDSQSTASEAPAV